MSLDIPFAGELISLLTAVLWAGAVILFRKSGQTVHPVALNLFKSLLAVVAFLLFSSAMGFRILEDRPAAEYLWLLASGALGIAVADSLFFVALNTLGASLTSIVDCTYLPLVALFSVFWLGEPLTPVQMAGIAVIGVALLIPGYKRAEVQRGKAAPRKIMWGLVSGLLAMATMAWSIVMFKPYLTDAPVVWVAQVRIIGGILGLVAILALMPSRRVILKSLWVRGGRRYTLAGSLLGGVVSMGLWLLGMKLAQTSVAAAINQTANLFIFVFGWLFLGELITRRKVLGIILGLAGVALVTFGQG
jgi:drug/metabolite transporter (DMT)-like permease